MAERAIRRAIESETGPLYVSMFSTRRYNATTPAGFKESSYPGLIFLHFARTPPPEAPKVIAYWKNEASFTAACAALSTDLSLEGPAVAGVVSEMRLGHKTLLQRFPSFLWKGLVAAAALIGPVVVMRDFVVATYSSLWAAPVVEVYEVYRTLDVVDGAQLSIPLKIRSDVDSRDVVSTTDSLRLEIKPGQSIPLGVEGERPPRVPPSQTVEFTLRSKGVVAKANASDPQPDSFQLKGDLLARAGQWRAPLRRAMPQVEVRVWSRLSCALLAQRSDQDDKNAAFRTFTGTIYPGKKHERATVFVLLKGAKNLVLSAREGNRGFEQEPSSDDSVKVVEWDTGQLEAFQSRDFTLSVRSRGSLSAEVWQKIRANTTITCQ